jgi:GNAT superfamily N-acetyltransferase
MPADPALLARWIAGWALARGKPAPRAVKTGWRVDVDEPDQRARYAFSQAAPEIAALAADIDDPIVFIKVCDEAERLSPLLPRRWAIKRSGHMMTAPAITFAAAPPRGYAFVAREVAAGLRVRIWRDGEEIGRGGAVVSGPYAIYDRIVVDEAHRRRGLARALMAQLGAAMAARGVEQGLLVATDEGRALYETVGWAYHAPYLTAALTPSG